MKGVTEVTASTFDQVVLQSDKPVVVDFYATWCGPCKQLGPIMKQLATDVGGEAVVVKVNADDCIDLAATYNVSGLPTIMFFNKGAEVERHAGVLSLTELKRKIDAMKTS